jgi:hypothetical protein
MLNTLQADFSREVSSLKESYRAVSNSEFSLFQVPNFEVTQLPPLEDSFGKIKVNGEQQSLFHQKVGNTPLTSPLLSIVNSENVSKALLTGEGLWRWRLYTAYNSGSVASFDEFIDIVVQYLSSQEKTEQIKLMYPKIIGSNEQLKIQARVFNENFQSDVSQDIFIELKSNQGKTVEKQQFTQLGDYYQLDLENLPEGAYTFTVFTKGKKLKKNGVFQVTAFNLENQFTGAQYDKLKSLAERSGGFINTFENTENTIQRLLENEHFKNTLKVQKKSNPLIDWRWWLALLILSLSAEWFIRKYRGLI